MSQDDPAVEGFDANENKTSAAPASWQRESYTSYTSSFPHAESSTAHSNSIYAPTPHSFAAEGGAGSHDLGAWNLAPLSDASYYASRGDGTGDDASHDAKRQRLFLGLSGSSKIGLYPKRESYARISCQACRKKKSKCVIRAGLRPSKNALHGDDRCGRCVKMDLACVIWSPSGRVGDVETGSIFSSSMMAEAAPLPLPQPPPQSLAPQEPQLQPPDVPPKRKRGRPRKYPRPEDLEAQAAAALGNPAATTPGVPAGSGAPAANAVAGPSSSARPSASSKKRPDLDRVKERSGHLISPAWPPPHPELLALHEQGNIPGSYDPRSHIHGSSSTFPPAAPAAGLLMEESVRSGASTPVLSERSLAPGSRLTDEPGHLSDMDTSPPPPLPVAAAPAQEHSAYSNHFASDDGSRLKRDGDAPDGLKEAASLTGDPYSLYSQFCLHLDGFASKVQIKSSEHSSETLDILKIVDDSLSRKLEIE
jgi:Fungal Zn(2)-Cys(6) binuclear cluster domain